MFSESYSAFIYYLLVCITISTFNSHIKIFFFAFRFSLVFFLLLFCFVKNKCGIISMKFILTEIFYF